MQRIKQELGDIENITEAILLRLDTISIYTLKKELLQIDRHVEIIRKCLKYGALK